jgi:hypothetical protein
MPGNGPVRFRRLVEEQNPHRPHHLARAPSRQFAERAAWTDQGFNITRQLKAAGAGTPGYIREMRAQQIEPPLVDNVAFCKDAIAIQPLRQVHHSALTMPSVIFLASPSSIIVLSR